MCRRAVRELVARMTDEGWRDNTDIVLVGFAFNRKFGRELGIDIVCRTVRSFFLECHRRAERANRREE